MLVFAVVAFFLIALALGFLLWPLLADQPQKSTVSRAESNKVILRSERDELNADIAQGRLQGDAAQEAIAELTESVQRDLAATEPSLRAEPRRWKLAAALAIALPSAAFGLYAAFGTPQALDKNAVAAITSAANASAQREASGQDSQASERPAMNDQQVLEMVEALKTRMAQNPNDPKGMQLLARSMAAMGRYEESAAAYEKLTKLLPNDAQVLADYADVLGVANNMNLTGKPTELIEQALKIDPNNNKALALLATAALNSGQFDKSLAVWTKLKATLPAGSPDIAQVDSVIAEVNERKKGGTTVRTNTNAVTNQPDNAPQPTAMPPATPPASASISGTIALGGSAKTLTAEQLKNATLFILARDGAPGASRMPLAVQRISAVQLLQPAPLAFMLDDSMAMAPGAQLSKAANVIVEARISFSGNAVPQPGDWYGIVEGLKPGAAKITIGVGKQR